MTSIAQWADHSPMSDPADHAAGVTDLPSDIRTLNGIVQGVLVHLNWLADYGLEDGRLSGVSRTTLPVADRLADILKRDPRPLRHRRPPRDRSPGTCRDFGLMLCSFLRSKGIPSRLRCGFAAYFGIGWEDHWICEYWDAATQAWRLSDPQLDRLIRQKNSIAFDPADVPRRSFLTAGQAWLECRAGRADPGSFGHGKVAGLWFAKVNVLRDHHVLNGREISAWDGWRHAPPSARTVSDHDLALLDELAAFPERPLVEIAPDWPA